MDREKVVQAVANQEPNRANNPTSKKLRRPGSCAVGLAGAGGLTGGAPGATEVGGDGTGAGVEAVISVGGVEGVDSLG